MARKGGTVPKEMRLRISNTLKGKMVGEKNPFYGKKHTEETKRKISKSWKMCHSPDSEETKRKRSLAMKGKRLGKKVSEDALRKNIESHQGEHAGFFGKTHSKETRKKMSEIALGHAVSEGARKKICEAKVGGFWYGNIRYIDGIVYCELWEDVNPRVHAFFNYKCVLCGSPENGSSHIGHHVFYVKKACCWHNENGVYYSNLNAVDHKENDYCIGENPNYFVLLCRSCHGKTNGGFINRKNWADYFRQMIDMYYEGKCYLTKEEFNALS
jgi:hypothetical protein